VGGVAVALAGGIALQTMFILAESEFVHVNADFSRQIRVAAPIERPNQVERFAGALREVRGAEGLIAYAQRKSDRKGRPLRSAVGDPCCDPGRRCQA
jgi:hypothetical protein